MDLEKIFIGKDYDWSIKVKKEKGVVAWNSFFMFFKGAMFNLRRLVQPSDLLL
jgi:hypothetical protein